jgi:hypothetical protein
MAPHDTRRKLRTGASVQLIKGVMALQACAPQRLSVEALTNVAAQIMIIRNVPE